MDILVPLKPHELRAIIGARFESLHQLYPTSHVGIPWSKQDITGELTRLIALVQSLPDK